MALTSRNYGGVEEGCVVNRRVLPASDNYKLCLGYTYTREPFWPSGKTLGWYAKGPRFESVSALLSLQKLWFVDTVLIVTL